MENYEPVKRDDDSAFCDCHRVLSVILQQGVLQGVEGQFARYFEVMMNTRTDCNQWETKESYLLKMICKGLGFKGMKFSDVINQAIVKGCIESAEFLNKMEVELGIVESE